MPEAVPLGGLRFGVLGALEVFRDGESCAPTAPLQRALLTLLLLHANEPLPVSRIVDGLWNDRPPRSAVAALQMYISAVRRILTPNWAESGAGRQHPILLTRPFGYVIRVGNGQLDVHRFRSLAAEGRRQLAEGRCAEGGELFRRALAVWRGPALVDAGRSDAIGRHAVRLETERLALLQERIGVDLCQGRSLELVGELEELCTRYPLRESFHQQRMLALYLSGSRAEALGAYQLARRTMVDEAGIEPGPGLRALQRAILTGSAAPSPHCSAVWCATGPGGSGADQQRTGRGCGVKGCRSGPGYPAGLGRAAGGQGDWAGPAEVNRQPRARR
ncbi:AfsR/SARP family transcriptional regulator [Micromonospora carbonacea]|uniref:AfsR/SARP family transcriptional regulator n=1 Tax=Micromonospora carbonacea TaxID=47853 RepID=UPI003D99F953